MIHLARIGRVGLLRELYAEILVPDAVVSEVARHVADELDAGLSSGWLRQVTARDRAGVDEILRDIGGRGEAEVIAVALATPLLDALRQSGFWLDDATYRKARELASEA